MNWLAARCRGVTLSAWRAPRAATLRGPANGNPRHSWGSVPFNIQRKTKIITHKAECVLLCTKLILLFQSVTNEEFSTFKLDSYWILLVTPNVTTHIIIYLPMLMSLWQIYHFDFCWRDSVNYNNRFTKYFINHKVQIKLIKIYLDLNMIICVY